MSGHPACSYCLCGAPTQRPPDKSVHMAGYSREDPVDLEFCEMVMVGLMLCHRRFIWMSKQYVPAVFFYSGLYRSTSLSDIHLTTLAWYNTPYTPGVLSPRSSFTGRKRLEIFLGGRPTHLMLCLASIPLGRPYVVRTYGRRATEVGLLLLRLVGSNGQNKGPSYLSDTIPVFPQRCLEDLHDAPRLTEQLVYWKDGDVIQGSGRVLCG